MNPNKIIRGKRPSIHDTASVDYLMHMVTVLAQELSATRDRLDTLERVASDKSLFTQADIEAYAPTEEALTFREANRQQFLENFFSVMTQEAAEVAAGDTRERFDGVIARLASER